MIFHKEKDYSIKSELVSNIDVYGNMIERVFEFKYLGLTFDPYMKFYKHYDSVKLKVSHRLKYLHGVKRYLSKNVMIVMLNFYVNSIIDIWAVQSTNQLKQTQDKIDQFLATYFLPGIARRVKNVYSKIIQEVNIYNLWRLCNFSSINERINYVILKTLYKDYINDKLVPSHRPKDKSKPLIVPPTFSSEIFKNSVSYKRAVIWNNVPKDILQNERQMK